MNKEKSSSMNKVKIFLFFICFADFSIFSYSTWLFLVYCSWQIYWNITVFGPDYDEIDKTSQILGLDIHIYESMTKNQIIVIDMRHYDIL